MPHFRVDDALHSHPKAQRAGDEAIGMWTRAGSYCMAYLTNGFVPEWWVKQQPKGTRIAAKLVASGLWHDGAELDGEKGYQFHEFVGPGRQDSREKIEADRELARKRKQKSRSPSQGESRQESQRDTPRDEQRPSRRTPGYTQPNPTQPITNGVTLGGNLTLATARDPHCPKHPDGTTEPCGACADARRAFEAAESERAVLAAEARLARARDIRECDECDDFGWALDDGEPVEPATRCANHEWETTHA